MKRLERLLFLGFLVRDEDGDAIFKGETHPQVSAVRFQQNLLKALEGAGLSIDTITTPPIAPFPRNRHWWVRGADYHLADLRGRGRQLSTPNLPGLRLLFRLIQAVRQGAARPSASFDAIAVYSVHTPFVAAALLLKWFRRVPVFVFIPDLPTFMGGPSHALKRILKRIEAAIVRRLLARADGAFPITDEIGREWLAGCPRHWAMEGISDAAAASLAAARENGSFVFRGTHRPILLYTGALEHVMTFATAFHRSPVDASVVFVGGGVDTGGLQALAAADPRIIVKPFMTGAALTGEVSGADFLLNPRDPAWPGARYSFPSKLFEYLITGKPVISTRLGGIPAEYFGVFRAVDLTTQAAFETSLQQAIAVDANPEAIWTAAERLARRLASPSVGAGLVNQMRVWVGSE